MESICTDCGDKAKKLNEIEGFSRDVISYYCVHLGLDAIELKKFIYQFQRAEASINFELLTQGNAMQLLREAAGVLLGGLDDFFRATGHKPPCPWAKEDEVNSL